MVDVVDYIFINNEGGGNGGNILLVFVFGEMLL